jgi:hypothetical protein
MQSKPPQFNSKFTDHQEHARDVKPGNTARNSGDPLARGTPGERREEPSTPVYARFAKKHFKPAVDKREIRMRRSNYGPLQWNLVSPAQGCPPGFRRWNAVLIAILAFFVLGAFVAAKAPHTRSNALDGGAFSLRNSESPTPVQHTKSNVSEQPQTHGHGRFGNVNKDAESVHHVG